MSFTLKCDNCENEIKLKTGHLYDWDKNITITTGPVGDDGTAITCSECKNSIRINEY